MEYTFNASREIYPLNPFSSRLDLSPSESNSAMLNLAQRIEGCGQIGSVRVIDQDKDRLFMIVFTGDVSEA